ncbi:carboxypeptidase S1 [Tricharina praecox]|uniref:carboxypeptidase S1 n=1 Tax=Tricharina praecox TaxID=43433 RepID=UPI00221E718B|nr:carboxypeptidase S1 [Tricharina praecox]KAI5848822.1 carboxypeptidase S1 [Tricharina praecox]
MRFLLLFSAFWFTGAVVANTLPASGLTSRQEPVNATVDATALNATIDPTAETAMRTASTSHGSQVSFKRTTVCETTSGARAYSGYIRLPADKLSSRNANPERQLTVWLNGGSGSSSLSGPFEENGGPCRVNNDSETTTLNPWSWNEHSDMLYIDQPNQFGFSYDTLVNSSLTMTANGQHIDSLEGVQPVPEMNATFYTGKLPSQVVENTANTTAIAAETMWHLLQGWTEGFPHHRRRRGDKLSIWSESYGGKYGTAIATFINRQNARIHANTLRGTILPLETLGIINGCVDLIQGDFLAQQAYSNVYDTPIFSTPKFASANASNALDFCSYTMFGSYLATRMASLHDIAAPPPTPVYVLEDLGVPVNSTVSSFTSFLVFRSTGDSGRAGSVGEPADLLDAELKVSMLYGDRDFICNWLGGEALSLGLSHQGAAQFRVAGYADVMVGGVRRGKVRQHGNLSFTRVFDAAHRLPFYRPLTASALFARCQTAAARGGEAAVLCSTSAGVHGAGMGGRLMIDDSFS